jgi:hypothetical protein
MAAMRRLGSLWLPEAACLLLVLLLLLPPPAAGQQQSDATIEGLYRFPLCIDGGRGCIDIDPHGAAPASGPFKLSGSSDGHGSALSAPGAGAVLSVAWDAHRPGGGGYVMREERRKSKGQGGEALVPLAHATALDGEFEL